MSDDAVSKRRNAVFAQLLISLLLIASVIAIVRKLLHARLILPIEKVGAAMQALGRRDYKGIETLDGNDELARLSQAVNVTIEIIEQYTRELERRRMDADQALHEADDASLAKEALVRTLAVDLEAPMVAMHGRLTEIAMANSDVRLKQAIREVIPPRAPRCPLDRSFQLSESRC